MDQVGAETADVEEACGISSLAGCRTTVAEAGREPRRTQVLVRVIMVSSFERRGDTTPLSRGNDVPRLGRPLNDGRWLAGRSGPIERTTKLEKEKAQIPKNVGSRGQMLSKPKRALDIDNVMLMQLGLRQEQAVEAKRLL